MNRRSRISPFFAGALGISIVVGAFYVAFLGVPFKGGHEVRAVFSQASEIHTRTPVRIAGVEVGKVSHVEREGGTAVVTMELDEDALPLHEDATVKVRPRIFLEGNFFLDLRPGTPSAPELDEGGTIPLAQTAAPVQLDQVLSSLESGTRENLQVLLREYSTALDEGGADAIGAAAEPSRDAFLGIAQVAEASRGRRDGDLSGFVEDWGGTAAALARREERLTELVSGLNRTTRGLASRRQALARTLDELDGLLSAANPALDQIDRLVPPAREFVSAVRPGIREAPATLEEANPLLDQVAALIRPSELPALRGQLDPALRSLASLEPKLTQVFDLVTPLTECLRRNAVPVLKSEIEDPPHSTGQPVYRDLLYSLVGLASAAQNFDGNGPAIRYHAGLSTQSVSTGRVPGTNELIFGLNEQPLLGSRPKKPAQVAPFRPDVPCVSQEPPNLEAETGPAPPQQSVQARGARR